MAGDDTLHGPLMDRVYRHQRHIYDLTRKYYLVGRDRLIERIDPPLGGTVLEIGSGTARNLVALAKRRPDLTLHGIDISTEMLSSATARVAREGLVGHIRLAHGDAVREDPRAKFGLPAGFDAIYFSYTLSMIPDWPTALARALDSLAPGGRLHIVDFGALEGLPRLARSGLYRWLRLFHVEPRSAEFYAELRRLGAARRAAVHQERIFLGYAWTATCLMPGARPASTES